MGFTVEERHSSCCNKIKSNENKSRIATKSLTSDISRISFISSKMLSMDGVGVVPLLVSAANMD